MILVFGASGLIGGELISILSASGVPAIAVSRASSEAKPLPGIRWTQADLSEPDSLNGLFSGVSTVFLLTGNHPDMARLQITAIEAAANAHVQSVVKLSALGASDHTKLPIGRAHYEAEAALMASGMRWTMLRPHVFMQNVLSQAPAIAREGRITAASGDGRIPFIDTRDIEPRHQQVLGFAHCLRHLVRTTTGRNDGITRCQRSRRKGHTHPAAGPCDEPHPSICHYA